MAEMKKIGEDIKAMDAEVSEIDEKIKNIILRIPNIPNENVPDGASDADNLEVRRWGEPTKFGFEPKAHWDLGVDLNIFDFERAGKITGSRFTVYKGLGARLERAIISYFLDTHVEVAGYTEILPPYMVNRDSMTGTGQLQSLRRMPSRLQTRTIS